MRPSRTELEKAALNALISHLEKSQNVKIDPDITDAPDALLYVDGVSVAIECRTITSQRILELHGLKLEENQNYRLAVPNEPHMWIRDALISKNAKIPRYRERTGAAHVALLLHSSNMFDRSTFSSYPKYYQVALVHGLQQTEHDFDSVLFFDDQSQTIISLTRESGPMKLPVADQQAVRLKALPVTQIYFGHYVATEGPDGMGTITSAPLLTSDLDRSYEFQPLDQKFIIDYVGYHREIAESYALTGEIPTLMGTLKIENG